MATLNEVATHSCTKLSCYDSQLASAEVQEIGFKEFSTELRRGWPPADSSWHVITCLEPLLNCQCYFKFWGCTVTLERNILRLKV